MSESYSFEVSRIQHRVLGQQIRLQLAPDFELRFTPSEASSISFALVAVRDGVSPEREIYMSPIASDVAFVGTVGDAGISIALATGALDLDWQGVTALANALAAAID
ncbi:MAG: hypothetical protein PXX77_11400 [Gallionella sp.]|nr:hypothetical protein [Gallionella sp.]